MTEKISRDEQKRAKAVEKAEDQIRTLAKFRAAFESNTGVTGEAGRSRVESLTQQMEDIAEANNLKIEDVLKTNQQTAMELSLLEKSYKNTKEAIARSHDPYASMHLESSLKGIESRIRELAEKSDLNVDEVMKRIGGMSTEDMQKMGKIELDKLEEERLAHEIKVTLGDPASREKYYEFEHKARAIVEKYGLEESHLERFRVPEITPELERKLAEVPPAEVAAVKEEIAAREAAPVEKIGFFKKLFSRESAETKAQKKEQAERDAAVSALGAAQVKYAELQKVLAESDPTSPLYAQLKGVLLNIEKSAYSTITNYKGELSAADLGPFRSLLDQEDKPKSTFADDGKDERFAPIEKESRYDRFKQGLKKYFKIGLFTAAALGKPIKTSDLNPIPIGEGKKIEAVVTPVDTAIVENPKTDTTVFMKTHAKLEAERVEKKSVRPAQAVTPIATPETAVAPIDTPVSTTETVMVDTPSVEASVPETAPVDTMVESVKPVVDYKPQIFPPLPVAPVPPGGLAPASITPQSQSVWSPRAHVESVDTASKEAGKIKVAYEDEKGTPFNIDSFKKKLPRIIRTQMDTAATKARLEKEKTAVATPEVISEQNYSRYKEAMKGTEYFEASTYKKPLAEIIDMWQLNKIAPEWFMQPRAVVDPNMKLEDVNKIQNPFETGTSYAVGGTPTGLTNTLEVKTMSLNYAAESQEKFNYVSLVMLHEYIHAWQHASLGMTDVDEGEVIAYYFMQNPNEFSSWRNKNFHPRGKDGKEDTSQKYPEVTISYPKLDDAHSLRGAQKFEESYAKLSAEKKAKYASMHEKMTAIIEKLGSTPAAQVPVEMLEMDRTAPTPTVPVAPIETPKANIADTVMKLPVSDLESFPVQAPDTAIFSERTIPELPPYPVEDEPAPSVVPTPAPQAPKLPVGSVPLKPNETYTPKKFDINSVPIIK